MIIKSPLRESSYDCPTMQVNRPSRPEWSLLCVSTQANTEVVTLLTTLCTSPQIRRTHDTMCSDAHCFIILVNETWTRQRMLLLRTKLRKHARRGLRFFISCLFLCLLLSFFSIHLFLSLFTELRFFIYYFIQFLSFSIVSFIWCFFRFMTSLSIHLYFPPSIISGMPKMTEYKRGESVVFIASSRQLRKPYWYFTYCRISVCLYIHHKFAYAWLL
jgi:hypothetical protein